MQLWTKQSFGHPSREHDAKPKIMSSAKRPGVLICAWHRVKKVRQPQAARAQAALASICLQMTMRTSPECAPHGPCLGLWVLPKEMGNSEKFKCEERKAKSISPRAGGWQEPAWGFRPCHSSGAVGGEVMGHHGKLQQDFSPACAFFQSPPFWGETGTGTHRESFFLTASALWKREETRLQIAGDTTS